jgi:hypothetical protein
MKLGARPALLLGFAGIATVVGCGTSAQTGSSGASGASPVPSNHRGRGFGEHTSEDGTGSLGLRLDNPDGSQVDSVQYVLTHIGGDGGVVTDRSGNVATDHSESIEFLIGGVPAGSGYAITVTASTTNGGIRCLGSASGIVIVAQKTTSLALQLLCTAAGNDGGALYVVGMQYNCATWNSLSTVLPDHSNGNAATALDPCADAAGEANLINLNATATGPDPNGLTYHWSQSADAGIVGGFGADHVAGLTDMAAGPADATTFFCLHPGTTTITLLITDGPVADAGMCTANLQTVTTTVTCEANSAAMPVIECLGDIPDPCPPLDVCAAVHACTNKQTDSNNCGACGTVCNADAGLSCVNGACVTSPPPMTTDGVLNAVGAACDGCAHTHGCVDDTTAGTISENCEDQTGNATAGPAQGSANSTLCFAELQCVLPPVNSCARVTSGSTVGAAIGPCYCGTNEPGTGCLSATDQNGVCRTPMENGLETRNPGTISTGLATPTTPGGVANAIVKCLISNHCGSCFP